MAKQVIRREQCPECRDTGQDNLAVYEDESTYCFGCGYYESMNDETPKKKSGLIKDITPSGLKKRGITKETCLAFGVGICYEGEARTVFPFYKDGKLVRQKTKTKDKEYNWLGYGKEIDWFGSQLVGHKKKLYITEGEEDCMALYQTLGGSAGSFTSLTNGASSVQQFLKRYHTKLSDYDRIVVCFDNDNPGRTAAKEFCQAFPVGKCAIAKLTEKDACEMLKKDKENDLKWACLNAEPEKPDGVVSVADLDEEYFDYVFEKGLEIPYPILNYHLGGLRKGELTMVSAGTGLGKSTWCTNLVYDLVINKGQKVVDIKLEETTQKTIYTYLAYHTGLNPRKLREGTDVATPKQRKRFIKDFKKLLVHDHFGSLNPLDLLSVLDYYATIKKVDFIFLDHISIAVSGTDSSRDGERKDIDKLVTKLRELIDRTGVGFVCVSHLKNPPNDAAQWEAGRPIRRSDLRGSGSLGQLSDNIIGIEGDLTEFEKKFDRKIKLIKTRYGDAQEEYCDTFKYDIRTGRIHLKGKELEDNSDDV